MNTVPPRRLGRHDLVMMALVLVVALSARFDAVSAFNATHRNDPSRLHGDEPGYHYLATQVASGGALDWPGRMPLYPMFVGTVFALIGENLNGVLYAQALVGTIGVVLLMVLAHRYHGTPAALLSGLIIAIHPGLVNSATRVLTEVVYVPLLLLAVAALFELIRSPTVRSALGYGLAVALATYCRPASAMLPVLVVAVGAVRRWERRLTLKLAAVATGGLLVALIPWTVHNWRTYGVINPLAASTGVLWQGSPEYYELARQGRTYLDIWTTELNPALNGGYDVTEWAGDRYFTRRGLRSIAQHPLGYAWYCLQKVAYYWVGHPTADWYFLGWLKWWERFKGAFPFLWAPLCLAAAWPLRRRLRSEFLPHVLVVAYFTLIHSLTWAEGRLSLPLHPLLTVWFACWAVAWAAANANEGAVPEHRSGG